jgi:[acyl-carrier-protein] S-malonyltransferase
MQAAAPVGAGAMAALLGIDIEAARDVARRAAAEAGGVCAVANDNGGGQVVVSGATAAVNRAIEIAKEMGARRSVLLPVSAPFHCALMQPAAEAMAEALGKVELLPPSPPLVANVRAAEVSDPAEIRQLLVAQTTAPVRWRESMIFMAEKGVTTFIECGAGKVLSGLVKRVAPAASGISIGTPEDIPLYQALA